jgi:hypothetical protein
VKAIRHASLTLLLVAGVAACDVDSILEVNDPDIVLPDNLAGAPAIPTIYHGALGDFSRAYNSSTTDAQVSTVGLMTDEFFHSGTFPTRQEFERRQSDVQNGTLGGVFRVLHRARRALENAADFITANAPTPLSATDGGRLAEMYSLAGFTYIFAAENYCSGMPYSKVEAGELQFGGPQTTVQSLDLAIARFDSGLAYANQAASTTQQRLARVGRARALLNKGDFAGAAAAIGGTAGVPTSFVYRTFHAITSARQENSLHSLQFVQRRWSLSHNEGVNGLGFRALDGAGAGTVPAQGDPRILWSRRTGVVGFDQSTPLFDQLKYNARNAATPLADGVEARLIEAENQLQTSDFAGWLATLNALRATVTGLAPLADPGTPAGRVDLHFKERAFWLFATAHRLGDMRRLIRQYGRNAEGVFPTGPYFKGGSYGPDVNLPIPFDEENNPQSAGCLDRNP